MRSTKRGREISLVLIEWIVIKGKNFIVPIDRVRSLIAWFNSKNWLLILFQGCEKWMWCIFWINLFGSLIQADDSNYQSIEFKNELISNILFESSRLSVWLNQKVIPINGLAINDAFMVGCGLSLPIFECFSQWLLGPLIYIDLCYQYCWD